MPVVFVLCAVGSFAIASRFFDIYVMLAFGIIGFFLRQLNYPMAPLVLGIVLGDLLDKNLRRGLTLSDGDLSPFFTRPISFVMFCLVAGTILMNIPAVTNARRPWAGPRPPPASAANPTSPERVHEHFTLQRSAGGIRLRAPMRTRANSSAMTGWKSRPSPCRRSRICCRRRDAREIRKIAEDAGVPVTGLHYLLVAPKGLSITSLDAAVRERTIDVIRRLIALAHDLGGTIIVHGSPAHRRLEPGHEEDGRRYGIECWAAIAKDAEAAGITYCIEPLHQPDANFVNTVEEAAAIVRQIGSPAVRTMIDCSAATIWEKQSVPDLIRQWMPTGLIAHIHFNDPNRRGPGEGELAFGPMSRRCARPAIPATPRSSRSSIFPDGATCAARNIGYMRGVIERRLRNLRSFPRRRESVLAWVPAFAGTNGEIPRLEQRAHVGSEIPRVMNTSRLRRSASGHACNSTGGCARCCTNCTTTGPVHPSISSRPLARRMSRAAQGQQRVHRPCHHRPRKRSLPGQGEAADAIAVTRLRHGRIGPEIRRSLCGRENRGIRLAMHRPSRSARAG